MLLGQESLRGVLACEAGKCEDFIFQYKSLINWFISEFAALEKIFDVFAGGVQFGGSVDEITGLNGVPVAPVWFAEADDVDGVDGAENVFAELFSLLRGLEIQC